MKSNSNIWHNNITYIFVAITLMFPALTLCQSDNTEKHVQKLIMSNHLDSLDLALNLSKSSFNITLIEKSLDSIIKKYLAQSDKDSALPYQLQLESHFEKYPNKEKQAALFLSMGEFYLIKKIPEKALKYFLRLNSELPINQSIYASEKIADTYAILGKLDSALIFHNKRIKYFRNIENINESIRSHQKISTLLFEAANYEKALLQNFELKTLAEKINNKKLTTIVNNNIGKNYNALKNYKEALKYFQLAEKQNKKNDYLDKSILYTNTGIVYGNLGDLKNAIRYLLKSEKDLIKNKNQVPLPNLYNLISTIYYTNEDIHNALNYSVKSIELAEKLNDPHNLKDNYLTSALIYQDLYQYEKALDFYQQHLNIRDSILLEERLLEQAAVQQQNQLERSEKEIKLLLVNQEVQNLIISQLELEKEKLNLSGEKLKLEAASKERELTLLKQEQEIADSKLKNQSLIAQQAEQKLALSEQKLINQQADQKLIALSQKEKLAQAELEKNEAVQKEKENEISILTLDKELLTKDKLLLTNEQRISHLQLKQEATFRNTAYAIGGLLSVSGLLFLAGLLNFRRKNRLLGKQKDEIEHQKEEIEKSHHLIEKEKSKSDALLLNILPKETATELKNAGAATPKEYKQVSVLFTDFSKFTNLSEGLSAEDLIHELNIHFLAFDKICEKYNIEKIKTIGDAYMCASGLPIVNTTHAVDIVLAAIDMQIFVAKNNLRRRTLNLPPWEMRAGIHSGPVIAGVVGSKKFSYDIWGDTVNTASRMESAGELGQVNISATTFHLIKHKISCNSRGKLEAKNKGLMEMYQVEMGYAIEI